MMVANRREVTNGAKIMDAAKIKCENVHAVRSVGLYFSSCSTTGARLAGGRGVNSGFSCSGALTIQGRTMDPAKVTMENTIKAMLPTRPTWPRVSGWSLASAGALYLR